MSDERGRRLDWAREAFKQTLTMKPRERIQYLKAQTADIEDRELGELYIAALALEMLQEKPEKQRHARSLIDGMRYVVALRKNAVWCIVDILDERLRNRGASAA